MPRPTRKGVMFTVSKQVMHVANIYASTRKRRLVAAAKIIYQERSDEYHDQTCNLHATNICTSSRNLEYPKRSPDIGP